MDTTVVLEGYGVRLEPVTENHLPGVRRACHDPALFEFTYQPDPFGDDGSVRVWYGNARGADRLTFTIVDTTSGEIAGTTRYFDIDFNHRKLEIGWTAIARSHWRTHVNTACKLLLLRYAFEVLEIQRVQFKAEALNRRSRNAIERIGATYEGTHRAYRIRANGEIRDTSFYSVILPEWPAVEARLTALMTRNERVATV